MFVSPQLKDNQWNNQLLVYDLESNRWSNPRCKVKKYEPCHDKTNIMRLRPAWIQTSLRIRAV
jgi:hypothetical protein